MAEHGDAHGGHHGFDLNATLDHHNHPYPALEWLHNKPVLIFSREDYVAVKQKHEPWLSETQVDAIIDQAWVMPAPLAFFNTQTFFGTIALFLVTGFAFLCRRSADQLAPKGRLQGAMEALVQFIRDQVIAPNMHHGESWTTHVTAIFLAVLGMNLMGLVPGTATATGNIAVTAGFAATTLLTMLVFGMREQGVAAYWSNLVPVPFSTKPIGFFVWSLLAVIELFSLIIKPAALAIRLFANMFAGHTVLLAFTTLGFILHAAQAGPVLEVGLGFGGFLLAIAIYFLELLVAFVQAFIFTLLSTVFIGASIHPEH